MADNNQKPKNRNFTSTILAVCAIAIVCLIVFLLGKTGVIRLSGTSEQAAAKTANTAAGTISADTASSAAVLPLITSTLPEVETASEAAKGAESAAASSVAAADAASGAAAANAASGAAAASAAESATAGTPTPTVTPTPSAAPTPTPTATPAPEEEENIMITTDSVNVRAGASTDTEIVGKLLTGTPVTVTGTEGDWTVVDYEGQKAYIKSEYLGEKKKNRTDWDLSELSDESFDFGYSQSNRDERNVPTDWDYYEAKWGEFNVDWIQDTSKNVIYLTMDEGFENDTTAGILDVLKEKDVKAVFFLTKYFVDEMPDMVQRMIDEGHQLGNHTCTHPRMPSLSVEEQTDQIMTLQNLVKDKFGYDMKYFRFPEGAYSAQSLGLVNNLGLKTVFWSYAYNDYSDEQPPVDESLEKAIDACHPGAIYLLHASSTTNAAFLADWIDACREMGYEFGIYPDTPN